jgi:PAS domain S-box-containing protein
VAQTETRSTRSSVDRVPRIAATLAVVIGAAVLAGWIFDVAWLRTFIPGATNPMVASTAVGFVLLGASLWLQARENAPRAPRRLGQALAAAAAVIGLLKISEYAFGWDLGIDQTLLTENPGPFPGQMALPTAITFVLTGAALAGLDVETPGGGRPAQLVLRLAMLFPLLGLLGRLYGVPTLSRLASGTVVMALHTSITFVLLCLGGLAARSSKGSMRIATSHGPAGQLLRGLLPTAVVLIVAAGWLRLQGERLGFYGTELGTALLVTLSIILLYVLVWRSARSLYAAEAQRERAAELTGRLAAIVQSSDDAILGKTLEGIITSWNLAAERLYGYSVDEAVGKPVSMLVPPDRAGEEQRILQQIQEGRSVKHYETQRVRGDGSVVEVSLTVSPVRGPDGTVIGASAIARDVTAQKRAQEALRRAREDAERANRAKSDFLSRMSHELRTPLNAILGFGQLMEMEERSPEDAQHLHQITKAGRHLLDLINEVLDIARIEAGRLSLSLEPVEVEELALESIDLIAPSASTRRIAVRWNGDDGASLYALADRQRLKQVLLNLLSNAVKYTPPEGEAIVTVGAPNGRVRVEVADTGPGIPPEQRDRLFVPFERLGTDVAEGTGLGLALSKGLVEAMGGRIGMRDRPGGGSVFWVELAPAEPPAMTTTPRAHDQAPDADGDARTVLYIEDNPVNMKLVERVLARRPGTRLLQAMQGRLGIELAREHQPDLVLLDAHLPDMHGEEVLRQLREDPATREIPVVVISADAMPDRVSKLLAAGARAYLTKPLEVRRLLKLIAEVEPNPARR